MALREIIARFGFQVDQKGIKKANSGIASVMSKLGALGVVLGAGAVARGLKNFIVSMVDAGDKLGKTATQLGLSGKELQGWQAAAGFAGVESEKFNQSLRILAKNGNAVAQGNKGMADKFAQLGVTVTDSSGKLKSSNAIMRETGLALGAMENRTEAVALAQELMGRTGAALLPLFVKGEAGLDGALGALERFGGGLSQEVIPLTEDAQDRFAEFGIATLSLKSKIAVAILPTLNQLTLGLSRTIAWISKTTGITEAFRAVIVTLGLVLAKLAVAKFGSSLLALGRAAILPLIKFALLALVVDDLIALFSGRASVIGEFIDKIFGKGTSKAVVDGIKSIGTAVKDLVSSGDLEKFDQDLEAIFGPPGQALVEGVIQISDDISEALDLLSADIGKGVDDSIAWFGKLGPGIDAALIVAKALLVAKATELGNAIVDGIVDAIKSAGPSIANALSGGVLNAVLAAKAAIQAKSPSKLTADVIGAPLVQGVAMGALDAARAAARLTSGALATASGLNAAGGLSAPRAGGGAGGGGATFNSTITITVNGGASDASISALRQGVRTELRDNRRATLEALTQRAAV